jgi:hypothetical protein
VEPVSVAVGAALLAVGYLGRRRSRSPRHAGRGLRLRSPAQPARPADEHCHAEVPPDAYDRKGRGAGHTRVACSCRQYVGPRPIDEAFAPRLLPPQD